MNQEEQARQFRRANRKRIIHVRLTLAMMATDLVRQLRSSQALDEKCMHELVIRLGDREVDCWDVPLRMMVAKIDSTTVRGRVWALIDMISSLADATGARWPYMTMDQRERYLGWTLATNLESGPPHASAILTRALAAAA